MVPSVGFTPCIKIIEHKSYSSSSRDSDRNAAVISPDDYLMTLKSSANKSRSIPITKAIHRTPSEIQLCEDEALADYRDYCMYARIVDGMTRRQSEHQDIDLIYENDACLANIRRTRCQPPEESRSLESQHQSLLHILGNPGLKTTHDFLAQAQSTPINMLIHDEDDDAIFVIDL